MSAIVAITHGSEIGSAIEDALDQMDLCHRVQGRLVAVKANDTWASPEDRTAVTQPETLRATLRYLRRLSPRRLVVVGGAGAAGTEEVFRFSGLADVLRQEGVELIDLNEPPFVEVALSRGPRRKVAVNPFALEIEDLVSLAQLKVHQSTTVTLSLKNVALGFPAAGRYGCPRVARLHSRRPTDSLHQFIAAMVQRFPIGLAIIAGHPAMVGIGPLGGRAVDTGLVVASTDPLAADVVGARILGFSIHAVQHLALAARLGIGEWDTGQMEIRGLGLEEAFAIFCRNVYGGGPSLR